MSGKVQPSIPLSDDFLNEEELAASASASDTPSAPVDAVVVPTVMLTSADASSFITTYRRLLRDFIAAKDKDVGRDRGGLHRPKVRLSLASLPSALDSELMGSLHYPKLSVRSTVIKAAGRGRWAAVMTSASGSGKDWQLYLVAREELAAAVPSASAWTARSPGGQPVSVTETFATGPMHGYSQLLAEQCPSHIHVRGGRLHLL